MGFYGNITNTAKTTFSFDLIYDTRKKMDENADLDGVFLGRYVLVDYDEEPIKAYYDAKTKAFYNTTNFHPNSAISGRVDTVYQDLHNAYESSSFYKWSKDTGFYPITSNSPYAERFATDVSTYGRGYDSTVWVKRYDATTNKYKYALIAELNAVIPTLHLVVDKPATVPSTPYFDRDTTNMDYYLHMQADYGAQIKQGNADYSDEKIKRTPVYWQLGNDGYPVLKPGTSMTIDADIYYNKAGFDQKTRKYIEETADNEYSQNTINYSMAQSGRLYGADADQGVYEAGLPADDIYEWYFRLPVLGNTICEMWDKVYDNRGNDNLRALNLAQKREDSLDNLVTYNKSTIMGMINTTRDLLGYYFIPIGTEGHIKDKIIDKAQNVTVRLNPGNGVAEYTESYPVLNCLFYDKPAGNAPITNYYHYAYTPDYGQPVTEIDENKKYYYKDAETGEFRRANIAVHGAQDADGNALTHGEYYLRKDRWTLVPLQYEMEDSLYALIAAIHNLLGTDEESVRNLETVNGAINVIKDLVANIDTNLAPGRLIHTDNTGVIRTTETYYPSSTVDANRVLVGNPDKTILKTPWENRVRSIEVLEGSDSQTSWDVSTGLIDTNTNNNNNIAFKAGNKWIGLTADTDNNQLVTIRHMKSAQAEHDFMTDVIIDNDIDGSETSTTDCQFTFPMVKTDNAGHVIGFSTKNIYIPYTYRNINLDTQSNAETDITVSNGVQSADSTTDTFTLATGNRWTEARVDEDKITISHKLVPSLNNDVTLNGSRRTKESDIANVYRYGLPQDKSIEKLDKVNENEAANTFNVPYIEVDKAGHVVAAETHTVTLPHNYESITIGAASSEVGKMTTDGVEGGTIDNNPEAGKTLKAETLTEDISISPANKWIRINGTNSEGKDAITIGHELHSINASTSKTDLDSAYSITDKQDEFVTQTVKWDNAGHIIGHHTETWVLPNSIRNISITGAVTENTDTVKNPNPNGANGIIEADQVSDTITMGPSNIWTRLTTSDNNVTFGHLVRDIDTPTATNYLYNGANYNTHEFLYDEAGHIRQKKVVTNHLPEHKSGDGWIVMEHTSKGDAQNTITYSHLTQGTAGTYGTNVTFEGFGKSVDLQGYKTDAAGHVIDYPTYTITLPKGSYTNKDSIKSANVITGMSFNDETGAIETTSENIGTLLLAGYNKLSDTTIASITAENTVNEAFAMLDNRIETEEEARATEIDNLRIFKTIQVTDENNIINADSNASTLTLKSGNDAISLGSTNNNTITIGHKTYKQQTNGLYKITVDEWGHVSEIQKAEKSDIGLGEVENKNIEEIIKEITSRFALTLNAPVLTAVTNNAIFTVGINDADDKSEYRYEWKKEGSSEILSIENSYTALDETPGTYKYQCTVIRTYANAVSSATKEFTYTVEEPIIEPEEGEEEGTL